VHKWNFVFAGSEYNLEVFIVNEPNIPYLVLSFWSREFGGGEHSASHVAARAAPAFMNSSGGRSHGDPGEPDAPGSLAKGYCRALH
jgi:hypothetical protein